MLGCASRLLLLQYWGGCVVGYCRDSSRLTAHDLPGLEIAAYRG